MSKHDQQSASDLLREQLPWLRLLPADQQVDCITDLLAHLLAGHEADHSRAFAQALTAWQSTAEVWSDHELADRLRSSFPGDGPLVPRPAAR